MKSLRNRIEYVNIHEFTSPDVLDYIRESVDKNNRGFKIHFNRYNPPPLF